MERSHFEYQVVILGQLAQLSVRKTDSPFWVPVLSVQTTEDLRKLEKAIEDAIDKVG